VDRAAATSSSRQWPYHEKCSTPYYHAATRQGVVCYPDLSTVLPTRCSDGGCQPTQQRIFRQSAESSCQGTSKFFSPVSKLTTCLALRSLSSTNQLTASNISRTIRTSLFSSYLVQYCIYGRYNPSSLGCTTSRSQGPGWSGDKRSRMRRLSPQRCRVVACGRAESGHPRYLGQRVSPSKSIGCIRTGDHAWLGIDTGHQDGEVRVNESSIRPDTPSYSTDCDATAAAGGISQSRLGILRELFIELLGCPLADAIVSSSGAHFQPPIFPR
jgi:hypothetical protein